MARRGVEVAGYERPGRGRVDDGPPDVPEGPEPECPIEVLGKRGDEVWYLDGQGEMRALHFRSHTTNGLLSLLGGDVAWAAFVAPGQRKGEEFDPRVLTRVLMQRAALLEPWNPLTPVRGAGVWPGPADDDGVPGVVVHTGDRVQIDGAWRRAGFRDGNVVYQRQPAVPRPDERPGPAAVAEQALRHLQLWEYVKPSMAPVLFGAAMLAMLGAVPGWRVHGLFTGEQGAGKSTLLRYLATLFGTEIHNDFTAAGVRQALTGQARAILLDETEAGDGQVEPVIKMIRALSGDAGLAAVRGSAGGAAQTFHVVGSVFLGGINPPELLPQDRARILDVEVAKGQAHRRPLVMGAIQWAAETGGGALRARMIAAVPRFRANLSLYRAALARVGMDARLVDQWGSIHAARDAALYDRPIGAADAERVVNEFVQPQLAAMEDAAEGEAMQCLERLLTSLVPAWAGGERQNLGMMIQSAARDPVNYDHRRLHTLGVKVDMADRVVIVANRHQALADVFRDSRWSAYGWGRALKKLPGVARRDDDRAENFGPTKSRVTRIPFTAFDGLMAKEAEEPLPPGTPTV